MFGLGKRTRRIVVAVVYNPEQGFLLVYNRKWRGYAFPTRSFPAVQCSDALKERQLCEQVAQQALRDDLGPTLGETTDPHWLDRFEVTGISGRTGGKTHYIYDVVTLVPVEPLSAGTFAGRFGFLTAREIRDANPEHPGHLSRLVTWTTYQVLTQLLDEQQVAIAVVCRQENDKRSYLMTLNRYNKFFFPAKRMGDPVEAKRLVVYEFRLDADYYPGRIEVEPVKTVSLSQKTYHLGPRNYTFHLCKTDFPSEDLTLPGNRLELALSKAGTPFRWFTEDELRTPSDLLSDTVRGLSEAVLEIPSEATR